jgi:hypothetical protein
VLLGFPPFLVRLKSTFGLQTSLGSPASGAEAFFSRWQSNGGFRLDSGPSEGDSCRAAIRLSETFLAHAEMDASLKLYIPAYASAILSTDELIGKLSVQSSGELRCHDPIASMMEATITIADRARSGCCRQQRSDDETDRHRIGNRRVQMVACFSEMVA